VRVITSLKWQDKFEEFSQNFAKLTGDLRDQISLVIQWTNLGIHSVAKEKKAKVYEVDTKLSDIRAFLPSHTAFEKEIALFLASNGGAERSLYNDEFLSRLVKKAEGWSEVHGPWRENRSVHFEPGNNSRRRTSSRLYSQEDDQVSRSPSCAASISCSNASRTVLRPREYVSGCAPFNIDPSTHSSYVIPHLPWVRYQLQRNFKFARLILVPVHSAISKRSTFTVCSFPAQSSRDPTFRASPPTVSH
jgi:hypothetical protein